MKADNIKDELYVEAQKRVSKLRWFYIHLASYLVAVALITWNLLIIEDTDYTSIILAVNWTTIIVWGFFIILHALFTFKKGFPFGSKWEEKKINEYIGQQDKTWE